MHTAPAGRVEHRDRWSGPAMPAVIRHDGPEPAGLRRPASRVQHRCPGLVHEDPIRVLQMLAHVHDNRPEAETDPADPAGPSVAQSSAIPCRLQVSAWR